MTLLGMHTSVFKVIRTDDISCSFSVDAKDGKPEIYRVKGNVTELGKLAKEKALTNPDSMYDKHVGIAHTRWSTHGMHSSVSECSLSKYLH